MKMLLNEKSDVSKLSIKVVGIISVGILLLIPLWYCFCELTDFEYQYQIYDACITIILIIIIYIWVYMAPRFELRIRYLKDAFDKDGYKEAYSQYRFNICFRSQNLKRDEICERSNKNCDECGNKCKFNKIRKTIYIIAWVGITFFLSLNFWKVDAMKFIIQDSNGNEHIYFMGISNMLLFVTVMLLSCRSFYYSFAYVDFLRNLTYERVEKFEFDRYLPSSTRGFYELVWNIKYCVSIFFLTAALITLMYLIITIAYNMEEVGKASNVIMTIIIVSLGTFASIVLFISAQFFLQRILNRWKRESLRILNERYDLLHEKDVQAIGTIIELKKTIVNDKINYEIIDVVGVFCSIVTIIFNIISILSIMGILSIINVN